MAFTDDAICLRRSDYSETSLVLRMMTRGHGQVSLIAKGVKRPKSRFGGSIDLLGVGQAVFTLPRENSVSTMGTLTDWSQTRYHPRLRTDLLRHATAMLADELLARLTEELDPHPASFDAIVGLLDELEAGDPPLRRLAVFGRTLLADVGLSPGLERCVNCGGDLDAPPAEECDAETRRRGDARTKDEGAKGGGREGAMFSREPQTNSSGEAKSYVFVGTKGGALCGNCRAAPGLGQVRISRQLRDFFRLDQALNGKLALEITRWLVYHVQNQIGRELTSAAALERAISAALAGLKRQE